VRVELREFPEEGEKPVEIFRLNLKIEGPGLGEPVILEALFPVEQPPAAAPVPGAGTPGSGQPPETKPGPKK
jgi:hypothetical protein